MDLQELEETAQLARLNTGKDELAAALPAFEQMIGFFAAMQEADFSMLEETAAKNDAVDRGTGEQFRNQVRAGSRLVGVSHFRPDAADTTTSGEILVDNAGERDGRFIVIPNVL